MLHGGSDRLLATAEQLLVHVDTAAGRSAPLPPELAERVAAVVRAHRRAAGPRHRSGAPMRHPTPAGREHVDFELTPEHQTIVETVRRFVETEL